jgi:hypothetical protein
VVVSAADIESVPALEAEDDAVLIIDTNRVVPDQAARQRVKAVPRLGRFPNLGVGTARAYLSAGVGAIRPGQLTTTVRGTIDADCGSDATRKRWPSRVTAT